jgi:hypothetical protein
VLARLGGQVKLPITPFFAHFDAEFGSSVGGIVSELPTIRPTTLVMLKT